MESDGVNVEDVGVMVELDGTEVGETVESDGVNVEDVGVMVELDGTEVGETVESDGVNVEDVGVTTVLWKVKANAVPKVKNIIKSIKKKLGNLLN